MKFIEDKNTKNENILKFYEYDEKEDEVIIVMELCDDNMLNYFSNQKKPLNAKEINKIFSQINNTLEVLQNNNMIYGYLNLENIFLKYEQNKCIYKLKITSYYRNSIIKNSPKNYFTCYLKAPEIIKGESYNKSSDIWNLGIIIYILSFKDFPYNGINEKDILSKIQNYEQKYFKKTNNAALDNLIHQLLIKDSSKRLKWENYFNHLFFKENKEITKDEQKNKKDDGALNDNPKKNSKDEQKEKKGEINDLNEEIRKDKIKNSINLTRSLFNVKIRIIDFYKDYRNTYDEIRKIGKGSFGLVISAKEKNTEEKRAIKVISKESIQDNL